MKKYVGTSAVAVDQNGDMFISDMHDNGLYKYSLESDSFCFLLRFPDVSIGEKNIHCDALYHEGRVFFLCFSRHLMHVFSCKDSSIKTVPFDFGAGYNVRMIAFKNMIKIISSNGDLWDYDMRDDTISICTKSYAKRLKNNELLLGKELNVTLYEQGFLVCPTGGDSFVKVDFQNEKCDSYCAPCDDIRYVFFFDQRFWIIKNHSFDIVSWEPNEHSAKEFRCDENGWIDKNKHLPYIDMISHDNTKILLNHYAKNAVIVNENSATLEPVPFLFDSVKLVKNANSYGGAYSKFVSSANGIFAFPCRAQNLFVIKGKDDIKVRPSFADAPELLLKEAGIVYEGVIRMDKDELSEEDCPFLYIVAY